MGVLIPSVLVSEKADLERKLSSLRGLVDAVQIDIVDGVFAAPSTWPYTLPKGEMPFGAKGEALQQWGDFRYEVDLMVKNPEEVAGAWIALGAQRVVIHVESNDFLEQLLAIFRERYGHDKDFAPDLLSVGFALNMETDVSVLDPFLDQIDYVQFMGIRRIGKQGQPFDSSVIQKIRAFKKAHPNIPVQVDGGVSFESAPELLAAGADRLVVGSALWNAPDLKEAVEKFNHLGESYGLYR